VSDLKLVTNGWLKSGLWKISLMALLLVAPVLGISWLSWTRLDFFQQHLENMPASAYLWLVFCFSLYLLGWFSLFWLKPVAGNRYLLIVAALIFAVSLVTPPLLSRDTAAYALNADILYHGHFNPYLEPLSLGRQADQLGSLWWLDFPSPYGPVFLAIIFLPWLIAAAHLLSFIFFYKLLVLVTFLAIFYLFRHYRQKIDQPGYVDWLFLLNPALAVNLLLEGHNEVFIILCLLWLFCCGKKFGAILVGLLAAIFIKLTAIIVWPLAWFKNQRFNWPRFIIANLLLVLAWSLFFWIINLTPLAFWRQNISFATNHCFYTCSPVIALGNLLPLKVAAISHFGLFIAVYLASLYFFLFKKYQPLKFIVWSFLALFFIQTTWLTSWYPTVIIPFSLLVKDKKYLIITGFVTAYCLWHYVGL
jgi:hypothetical protein